MERLGVIDNIKKMKVFFRFYKVLKLKIKKTMIHKSESQTDGQMNIDYV